MVERLSEDEFEAIKAANGGEAVRVETMLGTAVFRSAPADVFWRAVQMANDEKESALSALYLSQATVLHPARATWDQWCDRRPGLPKTCETAIDALAGLDPSPESVEADDGDTVTIKTVLGDVRLRCPNGTQFRTYQRMAAKKKTLPDAFPYLALACAVEPDAKALATMLAQKPGISVTVVGVLHKLAGLESDATSKK